MSERKKAARAKGSAAAAARAVHGTQRASQGKSWVEANDAASTLASLFTTLLRVCHLIKEADGGNSYQYNRLHRKKTASQPLFAEHPDTPAA